MAQDICSPSDLWDLLVKVSGYSAFKYVLKCGELTSWASADFFSGEGKIFQVGGKNILFALKTPKNILFSSKKVKNILFWPARGGQGPPLALPCGRP